PQSTPGGAICSLTIEGRPGGHAAGAVVSFGHVFADGDLPAGAGLVLRLADGTALPVQADVTVRHPSGAARHAALSLRLPAALAAGALLPGTLARGEAAKGAIPSGHTATLTIGGWTLDLLTAPRTAWRSGPHELQERIAAEVPASAAGGVTSLRVVADLIRRADGTAAVDLWLRNDAVQEPTSGTAIYSAKLVVDGKTLLEQAVPHHELGRAWGRLLTAARRQPHLRFDWSYVQDASGIVRQQGTLNADVIAAYPVARAQPGWNDTFGTRNISTYMPGTGGRGDIGAVPSWVAAWMISNDRDVADYCMDVAEAAGTIPWFRWDRAKASWYDPRPNLWDRVLSPGIEETHGWTLDIAHQPDPCFVPYMLSGRRALLDNLLGQAVWCVWAQWDAVRQEGGSGLNIVNSNQVRGSAWGMRQVDQAAWIAAPDQPGQKLAQETSDAVWSWLVDRMPAWKALQGQAYGKVEGTYGSDNSALPPWQQDYFASTAIASAKRGDARAMKWLKEFAANFLVGRVMRPDFNPRDAVAYLHANIDPGSKARPLTWAALEQANVARGFSNLGGWDKSGGDYGALGLATLAGLADLGIPGAAEA
ncbi:hypothetical protein, partial [Roseomonas indoligenes]